MEPRIRVLGGYGLCDTAGQSVRLATRKSWALLGYLALSGGRDLPREDLAALLWPLVGGDQARASLRQEMAVLRKGLIQAGLPAMESGKEQVRFCLAAGAVDALRLEELIKTGTPDALRAATGLYRGDLLGGLNVTAQPFEDWLWVERQRLKARVQTAYLQLLDMDCAGSDTELAIQTATALLTVEPTLEQGHRALMRLYSRSGRRTEALLQYQRCADILRREIDTNPSQETAALATRIRDDVAGPRWHDGAGAHRRTAAAPWRGLLGPVPERDETCSVTVVCLHLSGVAGPGRRCEPEELAKAQDRFAERCARVAVSHGGAVLAGPGDRVVACFGYPRAAASDTDRAIRAALSIVSDPIILSQAVSMWPKAGIARGSVVIRPSRQIPGFADLIGAPVQIAEGFAYGARAGEVITGADVLEGGGHRLSMAAIPVDRRGEAEPQPGAVLLRGRLSDA